MLRKYIEQGWKKHQEVISNMGNNKSRIYLICVISLVLLSPNLTQPNLK